MKVSILTPTYNRAYVIREALESALEQTYADFEIVVVDDGSTDNTREVVEGLQSEKIRYIRHEQNRGYSAACNTAISQAKGEILGFLDSDDRWKPDNLERQVGFLARHPEVDAVFSDVEIITSSGLIPSLTALMNSFPKLLQGKPKGSEHVFSQRQMYLCLLEEVPIKPTAVLVRRKLYDKAGLFNEKWPSGTDWDLFLRFSKLASFGYIDLPLSIQKWSADATHRKYLEQDKIFLLEVCRQEKKKLKNDREGLKAVNRQILGHCSNLGYLYLYSGRRRKSVSVYLRGFRETGNLGMLMRAGMALLPVSFRDLLKRSVKSRPRQAEPSTVLLNQSAANGESLSQRTRSHVHAVKVTVIVATYNRAYILRQALESALQQTYADFEIVVVDDGSTDNTREMVEGLKSEKIRHVRHEQNRGCSAAYNTGILAATGEIIAFLDSDDRWKPDNLERQMGFLARHPEVDAVFSDVEIIAGSRVIPSLIGLMNSFPKLLQGKPRGSEHVFNQRQMYLCLLEEVPVKPTAVLVRRELYDKAGLFNEAWPSGTDWDLFLRFSKLASFGYIDLPLSIQKWSVDATHRKYLEQDKVFLLEVCREEKKKLKNDREGLKAVNRQILGHCSNLGYLYLYSGRRRKSVSIYLRGFRETGDLGMLMRAGMALLPVSFRDFLKRLIKSRSRVAEITTVSLSQSADKGPV
jgi:glycosyltransferase involved in cell wall biosynthesis